MMASLQHQGEQKTTLEFAGQCQKMLEELHEEKTFADRSDGLVKLWMVIEKQCLQGLLRQSDDLYKIICDTQAHVVQKKWIDEGNTFKLHLKTILTSFQRNCPDTKRTESVNYLLKLIEDPWPDEVFKIINGNSSPEEVHKYCRIESPIVSYQRMISLLDSKYYQAVINFASSIIEAWITDKTLFKSAVDKPKSCTVSIVHLYLVLMLKFKNTSKLHKTLRLLPDFFIGPLVERCSGFDKFVRGSPASERADLEKIIQDLQQTFNSANEFVLEFYIRQASMEDLPSDVISSVISAWLHARKETDILKDVTEIAKFASTTSFLYELARVLHSKLSDKARCLSIELIHQALTIDINDLGIARNKKNDTEMNQLETRMSKMFLILSEVVSHSLPMRRECILTAFSLTPNKEMLSKVKEVAALSGFLDDQTKRQGDFDENEETKLNKDGIFNVDKFEASCNDFISKLESSGFSRAKTKFRHSFSVAERKERNLDGLISIFGELVTESTNYDALTTPIPSITSEKTGLPEKMVSDFLILVNAPRWHLLTWVLEWNELEERCKQLIENPTLKNPARDLKYLRVDYTQFEEWSSDEEVAANTGIELGYESWDDIETDEEDRVRETGLESDDDEIAFNVIPRLDKDEKKEGDGDKSTEPMDTDAPKDNNDGASKENGDKMDTSEDVKQTLAEVVPGLNDKEFAGPKESVSLDVGIVQVSFDRESKEGIKQRLMEIVPGLNDREFFTPPSSSYTVGVVQITLNNVQQQSDTTTPTTPPPDPKSSTETATPDQSSNKIFVINSKAPEEVATSSTDGDDVRKPPNVIGSLKIMPKESVDSLANSLISQIQTPILPPATGSVASDEKPISIKVEPNDASLAPVVTELRNGNISSSSPTKSPSTQGDLIRQLNLARSQGIVVLQQWGDKQVLVHRSTGRWIMRQGSRLVTVPPQALGITTATDGDKADPQSPGTARSPVALSSNTLEQLAEFDSILESKFKTNSDATRVPTAKQQGSTYVILAPATSTQQSPKKTFIQCNNSGGTAASPSVALETKSKPSVTAAAVATAVVKPKTTVTVAPTGTTTIKFGGTTIATVATTNNTATTMSSFAAKASPSKQQEDPDTLKRIQKILDNYNEQLKNSPDLQNRPAPRRRTNVNGSQQTASATVSLSPDSSGTKKPTKTVKTSPDSFRVVNKGSSVQLSPANIVEPGQITSLRVLTKQEDVKPVVRQIMVPPSLAASLQAAGRQLMVVTSPSGKKVVAIRPVISTSPTTTTEIRVRPTITSTAIQAATTVTVAAAAPKTTTDIVTSTVKSLDNQFEPAELLSGDRPATPGLGIPMEMTPGQIMEAEISASLQEDAASSPLMSLTDSTDHSLADEQVNSPSFQQTFESPDDDDGSSIHEQRKRSPFLEEETSTAVKKLKFDSLS